MVGLCVGDHPFDLTLVEVRRITDGDLLLGTGVLVASRDMQNAVGVDIEGHLDLGQSALRRTNVLEPKSAQHPVVAGALPLPL